jgi:putative aldouronate transport system substrate-binding protein
MLCVVASMILAACGQSPAGNSPPAATQAAAPTAASAAPTAAAEASAPTAAAESAAPTAAPATGDMVDLSLWLTPSAPEGAAPADDWEGYKIIRDKLGINLKFTMIPVGTDGDTKLNAQAAANDLPDLFGIGNRNLFFQFADQGLLGSVTDLLPLMPERTKLRYSNESLNKLVTVDGALYGLQEPNALPKRAGLAIRQDWLDKLGLKAPTTLDEFLTVAKAFTENDPDGNGKADTFGFGSYINSPGGNASGTLGPQFDFIYGAYGVPGTWNFSAPEAFSANISDPNYQKATAYIKQLVDAKVIDPDWPTMKLDDFRSRWKQGKYGMFVEDFCALICKANYSDFDKNNPSGKLVIIAPPKGPDGKSAIATFTPTGPLYAVSKKALDAGKGPAIAKFLEWSNSGEGYYLLGFGKQGLNYKLDAQGAIVTDGIDAKLVYNSKDQQPILQMKNLVYSGTDQELHARYVTFTTGDGRTIDPLEYLKTAAGTPWVDATAAALIKPAANQADIDRYMSENLVQFVLGQKPLDDASWAELVNGLAGVGFADWEASTKKILQDAGFVK